MLSANIKIKHTRKMRNPVEYMIVKEYEKKRRNDIVPNVCGTYVSRWKGSHSDFNPKRINK